MAIIVYPAENYNSFIDVATMDTMVSGRDSSNAWLGYTTEQKEALLINSFDYIEAICCIECDCDFAKAQYYLVTGDIATSGKYLSIGSTSKKYESLKTPDGTELVYNLEENADFDTLPFQFRNLVNDCLKSSGLNSISQFTFRGE